MKADEGREFRNFDSTMRKLMTVSHSEIKAKLDAEKAAKADRKKEFNKPKSVRSKGV